MGFFVNKFVKERSNRFSYRRFWSLTGLEPGTSKTSTKSHAFAGRCNFVQINYISMKFAAPHWLSSSTKAPSSSAKSSACPELSKCRANCACVRLSTHTESFSNASRIIVVLISEKPFPEYRDRCKEECPSCPVAQCIRRGKCCVPMGFQLEDPRM